MYNLKKVPFEQILDDYDFLLEELDNSHETNTTDTLISIDCETITLQECERVVFLLKSSLSILSIILRARTSHKLASDITNVEQAKVYKDGPVFYTRYVTKMFCQGICDYLFNSERIKILAFKNMTFSSDFQSICSGIRNNKSLKILFFKNCDMSDERCSRLCQVLRKSPVEILGLESCNITSFGVSWICWLLKEQSMLRTLATWSPSKYHTEYVYKREHGLRKLCLDNNTKIGDAGAKLLINTLCDDKRLVHVHLENTGITNHTCKSLVALTEKNTELEVVDVMRNELTSVSSIALAIENLSKNKTKVIRRLNSNNKKTPLNQKPKSRGENKSPMKEQSDVSLSNSDSSCINSDDNQRMLHFTSKTIGRTKNKNTTPSSNVANCHPSFDEAIGYKIKASNWIDFFGKVNSEGKNTKTNKFFAPKRKFTNNEILLNTSKPKSSKKIKSRASTSENEVKQKNVHTVTVNKLNNINLDQIQNLLFNERKHFRN